MRPVGLAAALIVVGMVPVAAAQAPELPEVPAPAQDAARLACDALAGTPASRVVDALPLCPGEDAQAGPAAEAQAAQPVADAEAEDLEDTAQELPAMAEGFLGEALADPASAPARAPGFAERVAAWLGRFAHALGGAVAGAGDTLGGAAKGAADGLSGVGLGLAEAAKGGADAVQGAAHQAGDALAQLGDAVSQLMSRLLPKAAPSGVGDASPVRVPGGGLGAPAEDLLRQVEDALPVG